MAETRKPDFWFSTKSGKHIPVFAKAGESKADAIKRTVGQSVGVKKESPKKEAPKKDEPTDRKTREIDHAKSEADKLNAESNYQDTLKKGAKFEINGDRLSFNGKAVDALDLSHAGESGPDSLQANMKDGKLTPERQKVHQQILQEYFAGHQPYAPEDEKVALFTGGGGASGKGNFSGKDRKTGESNIGKFYSQDKNPIVFDPDTIKGMLAKADGTVLDPAKSAYYHEESSSLAKQAYATALQNGYPLLYDGTATGGGIFKLLEQAEQSGYKTEMNFMMSDIKTVRANSLRRYERGFSKPEGARLVPPEQVVAAHAKAFKAVQKLQDKCDKFTLWDNAGNELKKVATSKRGEKLKVENQASYDRFSKSGREFTVDTDWLYKYRQDVWKIDDAHGKAADVKERSEWKRKFDNYWADEAWGPDWKYREVVAHGQRRA